MRWVLDRASPGVAEDPGVNSRSGHQHLRQVHRIGDRAADRLEDARYRGHPGSGGVNGVSDESEGVAEDVSLSVVADRSFLLFRAIALSARILRLIGSFTQAM